MFTQSFIPSGVDGICKLKLFAVNTSFFLAQ